MHIELLPCRPDFRAKTNSRLLAIADDGRLHKPGVIKDLVLFRDFIFDIFHICDLLRLVILVDQVVNTADCTQHAVKFLAGHTVFHKVDGLKLDSALLEPPLGFLCIKAFAFAENLNIQ